MKYTYRWMYMRSRMLRRAVTFVLACACVTYTILPVLPVHAISNDYILSDVDLFDGNSMSPSRIQRFLEAKGGYLATYILTDSDQSNIRASDIIAAVSQQYSLSPKFFLVLLEKEMSLITDQSPTQRQLDYALGYGCPSTCSSEYKGFKTQLNAAAKRIREDYIPALQQQGQFNGWGPGISKTTIDGITVTPTNIATSILYIYNPYVGKYGGGDQHWGANSLFQRLWLQWFVRKHPDGSLLKVKGSATIWLIRDGKRSAFRSRAAFFANYDYEKVITVDRDEIETYEEGSAIVFPEPSLVMVQPGGGVYLLSNGQKRSIASREAFRSLGFNWEEVIRNVSLGDLAGYPTGPKLTESDVSSSGTLMKSSKTGGIAYVDANNIKHPIYSRQILLSRYKGLMAQSVDDDVLASLPVGDPVTFRDGELIATRSEGKIYFISNGQRRPIPDVETFKQLGFKIKNVVWTNERSIAIHPLGEALSDVNAQ